MSRNLFSTRCTRRRVGLWLRRAPPPAANGWRHRHDAARVVAIFTDANCKNTFTARPWRIAFALPLARWQLKHP